MPTCKHALHWVFPVKLRKWLLTSNTILCAKMHKGWHALFKFIYLLLCTYVNLVCVYICKHTHPTSYTWMPQDNLQDSLSCYIHSSDQMQVIREQIPVTSHQPVMRFHCELSTKINKKRGFEKYNLEEWYNSIGLLFTSRQKLFWE